MNQSSPSATRPNGPHWIVPTYHWLRSGSFAYAFLFLAVFFQERASPVWAWALLVTQFLVYPQAVFVIARRSADSRAAEFRNLIADSTLLGIWCAALGWPIWISFTLLITSGVNQVITRGLRGLLLTLGGALAGGLLGWLLGGRGLWHPESDLVVTMCFFGGAAYLLVIAQVAYLRARSLRQTRELLLRSEASLRDANEDLSFRLAQVERLQTKLEDLAIRDPLTDLFNRRHFEATMQRELSRCRRESKPLSVMLIDIDHFKSINDRHGHAVGDEVLRRMAALLLSSVRQEDLACRFGGEEFVVMLPGMDPSGVRKRAEQMREAITRVRTPSGQGEVAFTASIGLATFPTDGESTDRLLHRADLALYAVKRLGRNGVLAATDPQVQSPEDPSVT